MTVRHHASVELKAKFPQVILVRLEQNIGKAGAIFAGLEFVKTNNLLLLDGDLVGVQSQELEQVYEKFIADASLDMIVLRAHGERQFSVIDTVFRNSQNKRPAGCRIAWSGWISTGSSHQSICDG